ncbi:hypothetical protein [Labrys wisconsinensis]|uniref:Uncharacterized protein n=1 Tax=Labrys wisconsinensis TaxID=425677 RepID=A0ABU0JLM6_9HYPH|nr:hypothetical protein [Labrys wisconsinensis]MDQ0475182.1 hypothetical protein [Labrys wisconsinensis]
MISQASMMISQAAWWEWLAIAWLALGLVVVSIVEIEARRSWVNRPPAPESLLSFLAMSAVLVVATPFILLYSLGIYLAMSWQGSGSDD